MAQNPVLRQNGNLFTRQFQRILLTQTHEHKRFGAEKQEITEIKFLHSDFTRNESITTSLIEL